MSVEPPFITVCVGDRCNADSSLWVRELDSYKKAIGGAAWNLIVRRLTPGGVKGLAFEISMESFAPVWTGKADPVKWTKHLSNTAAVTCLDLPSMQYRLLVSKLPHCHAGTLCSSIILS